MTKTLNLITPILIMIVIALTTMSCHIFTKIPFDESGSGNETPILIETPVVTATPMKGTALEINITPTVTPPASPTVITTDNPMATPTATPTSMITDKPTAIPTATPTATAIDKPTVTPTASPTAMPTSTPLVTITPIQEPMHALIITASGTNCESPTLLIDNQTITLPYNGSITAGKYKFQYRDKNCTSKVTRWVVNSVEFTKPLIQIEVTEDTSITVYFE